VIMVEQEEKNDVQRKLKSAENERKFDLDRWTEETSLCEQHGLERVFDC
jgi:hypothetical protein